MDLLCSDLHLSAATPALNTAFVALLEGRAHQARRVFLLGDLFEAWAGDEDVADPAVRPVIAALRALHAAGIALAQQHLDQVFGRAVAKKLTLVLFVEGDAVLLQE